MAKKRTVLEMPIGKLDLGESRFRLHVVSTDIQDLVVTRREWRYTNEGEQAVVTDAYKVVDILNEVIDDYHYNKNNKETSDLYFDLEEEERYCEECAIELHFSETEVCRSCEGLLVHILKEKDSK